MARSNPYFRFPSINRPLTPIPHPATLRIMSMLPKSEDGRFSAQFQGIGTLVCARVGRKTLDVPYIGRDYIPGCWFGDLPV